MNIERPILLTVLDGKVASPPPVWLMRQAGRYLPEYRALRARVGSFWTMCMTPEHAVEVTLQPIRRFDLDAAILFSDILVIPYVLGQEVRFEDGVGPILAPLGRIEMLERSRTQWRAKLEPIYEAVTKTREKLEQDKALIGFAGAPWTLAAYMIEGRGSPDQRNARLYAYRNPQEFSALLECLSEAVALHLGEQIEAGADAVQIFDSWAGGLPASAFAEWVIAPTRHVVERLRIRHPAARVIGFPRGATQSGLEAYIAETGIDAVGIDTATPIGWAAALGERVVVQGNLDPLALVAGGAVLERATDAILEVTRGIPFIFNLGHGVLPETPVDHVAGLIARIRGGRTTA